MPKVIDNLGRIKIVQGSSGFTTTTITSTTTAVAGKIYLANTAGGSFNVNLPNPTTNTNSIITVKKTSPDISAVTILPFASETIDGQANRMIYGHNNSVTMVSNGTNWYIIAAVTLIPSVGIANGSSTASGASNPLLSNLVSFWKLNNASVTDSFDSNSLTATITNPPQTAVGPTATITQATYFNSPGSPWPAMTKTSNASLVASGSMFMSCWTYLQDNSAYRVLAGKQNNILASGTVDYLFYYNLATNRFAFAVSDGSANYSVDANTLGAPTLNTWYLLTAWYDVGAHTVNIVVNSQTTPDSAAGPATHIQTTSGFPFTIGAPSDNSSNPWFGNIASLGLWIGRTPAVADLNALWNGGQGQTWPFV